jgi:hypothetical protein
LPHLVLTGKGWVLPANRERLPLMLPVPAMKSDKDQAHA